MNSADQNNTEVKHYTLKECKELATRINSQLSGNYLISIPEVSHPWDILHSVLERYQGRLEFALALMAIKDTRAEYDKGEIERYKQMMELRESSISSLKQKIEQIEANAPMKHLLLEYEPKEALTSIGLIMDVMIETEGKEEVHWTDELRFLRKIQDEFIALQGK